MKLYLVKGNTYVIDGINSIPFYKVSENKIVLLDSGIEEEREELCNLFEREKLHPMGIISSHSHRDHCGNNDYFKKKYGCKIAASLIEAGSAVNKESMRSRVFPTLSPPINMPYLSDKAIYDTDYVIMPWEKEIKFCGASFQVLPLVGHTEGHIGIITQNNVCYVGDCILSEKVINRTKLASAYCHEHDLQSKQKLYSINSDYFILAHKGVYDDITDLINLNIKYKESIVQDLLSLIEIKVSYEKFIALVWEKIRMSSTNPFKIALFNRNVLYFTKYLISRGDLTLTYECGVPYLTRKK